MYQSPISIYEAAMETIMEQRENAIFAKIQDAFDVQVDKEELIRALQYDRNQYEAGYRDGKADALNELVRCKDCKRSQMYCLFNDEEETLCCVDIEDGAVVFAQRVEENHFCSYGERKDNG